MPLKRRYAVLIAVAAVVLIVVLVEVANHLRDADCRRWLAYEARDIAFACTPSPLRLPEYACGGALARQRAQLCVADKK